VLGAAVALIEKRSPDADAQYPVPSILFIRVLLRRRRQYCIALQARSVDLLSSGQTPTTLS
jgi:hypothetical protein